MVYLSKRYRASVELVDRTHNYTLDEAVELLQKMPAAKFDETVELSVKLGVDPKHSDQMVRGVINLPNGSGKKVRVLAFCEDTKGALEAGADYAGLDDLIKKVKNGWVDFDVAVSTPAAMKEVRAVARVLGPRGLMPNPKSGTVTDDIAAAVNNIKHGGRIEFKMDKTANIGVVVGKRSFTVEQLIENIKDVIENIGRARPDSFKGKFIQKMSLSSTMSPGLQLDASEYSNF